MTTTTAPDTVTLETLTGRQYLSYSALDSWLTCGERFRLERVLNVPQSPAWWFVGGTAFHSASEHIDTEDDITPQEAWDKGWAAAVQREWPDGMPDPSTVRAGGRVSKAWPNKENHEWWAEHGPGMVEKYQAWRSNSDWELVTFHDTPAVEVPFDLALGDVLIHGYIDRVFVNPNGELIVVDLKTGSRTPASNLQLGVYARGLAQAYGVTPILGSYFMSRDGETKGLRSLHPYTDESLARWFGSAKRAIESEVFIPHVTSLCNTCSVAPFCEAVGGDPLAAQSNR